MQTMSCWKCQNHVIATEESYKHGGEVMKMKMKMKATCASVVKTLRLCEEWGGH